MSLKNNRHILMRVTPYLFFALLGTLSLNSFAFPVAKYAGFGLGYTYTETTVSDPETTIGSETQTPTYSSVKNRGLPWNAYMGLRFHPNYAFEFGFLNYGSIKFVKTLTKKNATNELIESSVRNAKISTRGFYLSHVLFYNISKRLNMQLKAGVIFGSNNYTDDGLLTIQPSDDSSSVQYIPSFATSSKGFAKAHLAMAMAYRYNKDWSYQLQLNQIEYDHDTELESFEQWFTSLSARYHF